MGTLHNVAQAGGGRSPPALLPGSPAFLRSSGHWLRSGSGQCEEEVPRGHEYRQQEVLPVLLTANLRVPHTFLALLQQHHHLLLHGPLLSCQQPEILPAQHLPLPLHPMALQVGQVR